MSEKQKTHFDISRIKNLPPLPESSVRILSAVNDPDISIDELVNVLFLSPVLSARLLGLANSSYFGWAGKIDDLRDAVIKVLGVNLVKSLALSLVLNMELDTSRCRLFNSDLFWNNSLLIALIAQKLAMTITGSLPPLNVIYTSGLLLDIGVLTAVHIAPETLNEVFTESEKSDVSVLDQIHVSFGLTQYEMGWMLLENWELPLVFQSAVQHFEQMDYDGEEKELLNLLRLSVRLSKKIMTDEAIDNRDFSDELDYFSLSRDQFDTVLSKIVDSKDKISELATNMTH